jgi:hypothetical protein
VVLSLPRCAGNQRETGNRDSFSGHRSRPPGLRFGLSGTGAGTGKIQVLNLYPNLRTCTWYLTAETRDLKVYAPSQSSGLRFPFERCLSALGRVERPRSTVRLTKGGQPYQAAEWWPRVGAWLRRALLAGVHDESCPYPMQAMQHQGETGSRNECSRFRLRWRVAATGGRWRLGRTSGKGRPGTGMYAARIYPQPIIRSPVSL